MRSSRRLFAVFAFGLCLGVSAAAAAQGASAPPAPGPEHQLLSRAEEGTWDAAIETFAGPGVPPLAARAVEVNTTGCNGLCVITDLKGELIPGQPFHGHGTATYDPVKKKYVGSWSDSLLLGIAVTETSFDAAMNATVGFMDRPGPSGQMIRSRTTREYKGATRVFTMYGTGPDGKEVQSLRITYTRRP